MGQGTRIVHLVTYIQLENAPSPAERRRSGTPSILSPTIMGGTKTFEGIRFARLPRVAVCLLRDVHALQQLFKSRIGPKVIPGWVGFEKWRIVRMLFEVFLQPRKCPILIT
jgi:hypothetical protein